MNKKRQAYFIGGLVGVILTFSLFFLKLGFLIAIIIGASLGVILTIFLLARSRGEKPENIAEEVVAQVIEPSSVTRPRNAKDSLMDFQQTFVMNTPSDEIRNKVFDITDNLLKILDPINKRFSGSQITWEVTQMAIEHFPNRVLSYLKLDDENREIRKENLFSDLSNMQSIIDKVSVILQKANISDDEREDMLSNIKYANNL